MNRFDRITQTPASWVVRLASGGRVTVGNVVGQIGAGRTVDDLLTDYAYLEREDILQALRYAAWLAEEREAALPGA
jgi:uncharacterized protein (DUF433 family)